MGLIYNRQTERTMPDERNLVATAILDFADADLTALARELRTAYPVDREVVRAAHAEITRRVSPVYTIDELQPASLTLRKSKGSCSQRMAILEALARAAGIATRARVLWVAGRFWYRRFHPVFSFSFPGAFYWFGLNSGFRTTGSEWKRFSARLTSLPRLARTFSSTTAKPYLMRLPARPSISVAGPARRAAASMLLSSCRWRRWHLRLA